MEFFIHSDNGATRRWSVGWLFESGTNPWQFSRWFSWLIIMVLRKIKDMGPNIHTTTVILQLFFCSWKIQITWEVIEVIWFGSFKKTVGSLRGLPRTGTGDPLKFKEPPDAGVVTAWYCRRFCSSFRLFSSTPLLLVPCDRCPSEHEFLSLSRAFAFYLSLVVPLFPSPACSFSTPQEGRNFGFSFARSLANQEISQVSRESTTLECYCRLGKFERIS